MYTICPWFACVSSTRSTQNVWNNLTERMFVVEALTKLTTAGVDQLKGNQIYRSSIGLSEMQRWLVYVNRFDGLFGRWWWRRRTHLCCFFWVLLTNEISIEKHFSFPCKRKIIDGNSTTYLELCCNCCDLFSKMNCAVQHCWDGINSRLIISPEFQTFRNV